MIEIVTPGDCLVCFVRGHTPPDGDIGATFLIGLIHGQKGEETLKRLEATMCPKHAKNYADMKFIEMNRHLIK